MHGKNAFFAALSGAFLLAGCSPGGQDGPAPVPSVELETVEISCSLEAFSPTRASLDGVQLEWSAGDGILVEAEGLTYPFTALEDGPTATFRGSLPVGTGKVRAWNEVEVPAVQDGSVEEYIPCSAEGDLSADKYLDFTPSVALVRLEVDRDDILYIQLSGEADLSDGSRAVRRRGPGGRCLQPGIHFLSVYPASGEKLSLSAVSERGTYTLELTGGAAGDFRVVKDAVSAWTSDVVSGPKQFIFVQSADWQYNSQLIREQFGPWEGTPLAVGEAAMFYIFERPIGMLANELRSHLAATEQTGVPILVELDPITFWDDVPELWNWFDPSLDGYDEANRENVEWTSWSSADAVKIGWLNWGRQIRLRPMANLFSPAYQAAVRERMGKLLTVVSDWYKALPAEKKYLLAGIKIIGEFAFGVNNWYYPDGNSYYGKDASGDPTFGLNASKDPSWGVQQMGYAALTYSGMKTSGTITAGNIVALEKAYVRWLVGVVEEYGFPRDLLFAHSGCWHEHLSTCIHEQVCPSWSWYSRDDISKDPYIMNLIRESSAPWWGVAEWAIGSSNSATYERCLKALLAHPGCRFVSVFENVVGDYNAGGSGPNEAAVAGIRALVAASATAE